MGIVDKMKSAAQAMGDRAKEWVDSGFEKLKSTMDSLTALSPELTKIGFRLTDVEIEMTLLPRLIIFLERDREATREEFQALLANHAEHRTFCALVTGLEQANRFDQKLGSASRRLAGMRVEMGLPPTISLRYVEVPPSPPLEGIQEPGQ